jgi:hypothetical protein
MKHWLEEHLVMLIATIYAVATASAIKSLPHDALDYGVAG